jgi:hypothetical protein
MKLLLNIFLVILSILLKYILFPFGFLWTILKAYYHVGWQKGNVFLADWFYKIAVSQDQLGNVMLFELLNTFLIKSDYPNIDIFGSEDETISSVLGKNKRNNTLRFCGEILVMFLNILQKNHVEKAIGN